MAQIADVIAEERDWLVCHDCGALQTVVPITKDLQMVCNYCETPLHIGHGPWLDKATALTVTAFILFVSCNIFTFLTLKIAGIQQAATILSGVAVLIDGHKWILAALVFVTIFLLPLFEVLALLYLLLPYLFRRHLPGQIIIFRWLINLQSWIMLDVFLLGVLVTAVKLGDKATVILGPGLILFFALVATLRMAYWLIDKNNIWSWLYSNNCFSSNKHEMLYDCNVCKAMVGESIVEDEGDCPRCKSRIYKRIPDSIQKTMALIIAAIILYIPANLYPIMLYDELGINYDSTILSGVAELAENGLWLVAIVVFIASIVVPIAKLVMLIYLVWSVHVRMKLGAKHRVILYRITEFIGRWSMVDVYVVTLLTAVVQFGLIGVVEPGPALLPFAAVVVLTMLAVESFDSRLIWDYAEGSDFKDVRKRTLHHLSCDMTSSSVNNDAVN